VEGRKSGDGVGIGYISINLFVREPSFLFFKNVRVLAASLWGGEWEGGWIWVLVRRVRRVGRVFFQAVLGW
jgi:hypothetical protein